MRQTLLAMAAVGCLFSAGAASAAPASPTPGPTVPGWEEFTQELARLGPSLVAKLPPRLQNDPQVQQEVGRLMLEALAARTLEALGADGDHPVFVPSLNVTMNVYQPNADTVYKNATITPGGAYRLRGRIGTLRILSLGQFGPPPQKTGAANIKALAYNDFRTLHVDKDGRFDVILSPTRPPSHAGDWWRLDPQASNLTLRQVAADWRAERDPQISIERLDAPAARPRPSGAELEQRLRNLGTETARTASFLFDHVEKLRQEGYVNKLKIFDVVGQYGGLVGQFYYEGAYDLKPDEALIVEAKVPAKCRYGSLILTNDIYETTDWYNNHSSLNDTQWQVDADGVLRVVVSARDPGVPNWLDTAGYPSGVIQGRWTECDAQPIPSVRKVAISDIRRALPAATPTVTPAQRDEIVRERRANLQQRPLW